MSNVSDTFKGTLEYVFCGDSIFLGDNCKTGFNIL